MARIPAGLERSAPRWAAAPAAAARAQAAAMDDCPASPSLALFGVVEIAVPLRAHHDRRRATASPASLCSQASPSWMP